MFIRRRDFDRIVHETAVSRAKLESVERQVTQQQTLMSFLCARLTAVEKERAALLLKLTGVEIQTPTFAAPATPKPINGEAVQLKDRLGRVPSTDDVLGPMGAVFEDMGDRAAEREGIEWSGDGTVRRRSDESEKH